ncbi:uncharacterized protein BXZ73DRAFT_100359 [Epithele typhae]|uniref:uncharacterized protein n=1 Tax=Epithele typhae TaxID=378194 RepID=UPI002008338D|nr:uncharacterized protein BXZ73DRAFT_100359 [Epithele typhae]KAH9935886.1 hypothetical protein BXZ73DRAFT_100359 [Epithele typhae]
MTRHSVDIDGGPQQVSLDGDTPSKQLLVVDAIFCLFLVELAGFVVITRGLLLLFQVAHIRWIQVIKGGHLVVCTFFRLCGYLVGIPAAVALLHGPASMAPTMDVLFEISGLVSSFGTHPLNTVLGLFVATFRLLDLSLVINPAALSDEWTTLSSPQYPPGTVLHHIVRPFFVRHNSTSSASTSSAGSSSSLHTLVSASSDHQLAKSIDASSTALPPPPLLNAASAFTGLVAANASPVTNGLPASACALPGSAGVASTEEATARTLAEMTEDEHWTTPPLPASEQDERGNASNDSQCQGGGWPHLSGGGGGSGDNSLRAAWRDFALQPIAEEPELQSLPSCASTAAATAAASEGFAPLVSAPSLFSLAASESGHRDGDGDALGAGPAEDEASWPGETEVPMCRACFVARATEGCYARPARPGPGSFPAREWSTPTRSPIVVRADGAGSATINLQIHLVLEQKPPGFARSGGDRPFGGRDQFDSPGMASFASSSSSVF